MICEPRHSSPMTVIGRWIDDVTVKDAAQSDEDFFAFRLILSCCTPRDSRRFLAVAGIRRESFSFFFVRWIRRCHCVYLTNDAKQRWWLYL
ncbi:uncharacterized protein TNCT_149951 [Trichonephila clavata]|uniref:Uncharacterized protein n=1 Tax=Trichonephila clavata TaxID=2740835 RepID=A0A8X6L5V5_TRICU|nr:uncharacterized protein TNCT_149951 [Trichonephila clavata]